MGFGGANLTGGGGTNFFTLKGGEHGATGHNLYRILPSYGKLEASDKWFTFFGQHFGFRGVSPNGDSEGSPRPFKCIREKNRKSQMVTVECPACVQRDGVQAKKDLLEQKLKSEGADKATIQAATKEYSEWLMANNLDKKFYVAAMNQKREFGILKLPFEAKDKLQSRVKEVLEQEGVNALLVDQGVWFDIKRTGERLQTSYDVDVVYEVIQGEGGKRLRQLKTEPLSAEEQDKALKSLPELSDLPRVLTEAQIQALVDLEGGGDPETVDAIMGVSAPRGTQERNAKAMVPPSTVSHVGSPPPQAIRPQAQATMPSNPPQVVSLDASALMAQIQALQAQLAAGQGATPAAAAPAPTAPAASFTPPASEGDDAQSFMKNWGFSQTAAAK